MARFIKLKNVKKHDYFVIPTAEEKCFRVEGDEIDFDVTDSRVKVRGDYDRSSKKYFYHSFVDICREYLRSGNTLVIVDFIF